MLGPLQGAHPIDVGLAALAALYTSTWVHEAGHALAGLIAGFRITSIGTGFGVPLFRLRLKSTVFFMSPRRLFQGITTSVRDDWPTSRFARAFLLAGGFSANLLAAGAAFTAYALIENPSLPAFLFGLVNALFALFALLPTHIALPGVTLKTDAAQLLALFARSPTRRNHFERIPDGDRFVAFLSAIRDAYGQFHHRIHLASALSQIGNHDRALDVLESVQDDLYPGRSPMGALLRAVRGSALLGAGEEERGLEDLRRSEDAFRESGAPDMAPHIALLQAKARLERGKTNEAKERLDSLDGDAPSDEERLLRAEIDLQEDDPSSALEKLDAVSAPSGEEEIAALGLRGEALRRNGDLEKALEPFAKAAERLLANLRSLAKSEDKEAYLEKHRRIRDGWPKILEAAGKEEKARRFEEEVKAIFDSSRGPGPWITFNGLSALTSAGAAAVILVLEFMKIARFEGSVASMRWVVILSLAALYFSVSAMINRRVRKFLPMTAAAIGVICLIVVGVFFTTLVLTRRNIHREILEYDLDHDGNVDKIVTIHKGIKVKMVEDQDFDGTMDHWVFYENGVVTRERFDTDGDGKPDIERRRKKQRD